MKTSCSFFFHVLTTSIILCGLQEVFAGSEPAENIPADWKGNATHGPKGHKLKVKGKYINGKWMLDAVATTGQGMSKGGGGGGNDINNLSYEEDVTDEIYPQPELKYDQALTSPPVPPKTNYSPIPVPRPSISQPPPRPIVPIYNNNQNQYNRVPIQSSPTSRPSGIPFNPNFPIPAAAPSSFSVVKPNTPSYNQYNNQNNNKAPYNQNTNVKYNPNQNNQNYNTANQYNQNRNQYSNQNTNPTWNNAPAANSAFQAKPSKIYG